MNIFRFLGRTRNPHRIFDFRNRPDELAPHFKLYEDMLYHFDLETDNPLELILTQSSLGLTTQIVTLAYRPFIVLELQEVERLSQVMEFFIFHDVENSPISYFHELWMRFHERFEQLVELKGPDGKPAVLSGTVTARHLLKRDPEVARRLAESKLPPIFYELRGFDRSFEIAISFALAHEIAHYHYVDDRHTPAAEETIDELTRLPWVEPVSPYLSQLIKFETWDSVPERLREELYCDCRGLKTAWNVSVERHWIDARLFSIMLCLTFNGFFAQMLMSSKWTKSQFTELGTRKAYALLWGLNHLARRVGDVPWIRDYERYLCLLDNYCFDLAIKMARFTNHGLRADYKDMLEDFMIRNLHGYLSSEEIKKVTIPLVLENLFALAEKICADREIV